MSTQAATAPATLATESATASSATKALLIGAAGLGLTAVGAAFAPDRHAVVMSYLVGIVYWTAIALGMLLLILIHHITDASWSTVIRRQWEHAGKAFTWLFVLFLPLLWLIGGAAIAKAWKAWKQGELEQMSAWEPKIWPFLAGIAIGVVSLGLQCVVETVRHGIGIVRPTAVHAPGARDEPTTV